MTNLTIKPTNFKKTLVWFLFFTILYALVVYFIDQVTRENSEDIALSICIDALGKKVKTSQPYKGKYRYTDVPDNIKWIFVKIIDSSIVIRPDYINYAFVIGQTDDKTWFCNPRYINKSTPQEELFIKIESKPRSK